MILGNLKTVTVENPDYLASQSAQADFVAVTVADTTFIANKNIVPRRADTVTPDIELQPAIITITQTISDLTYSVVIDAASKTTTYTATTPAAGTISATTQTRPRFIKISRA